MMMTRGGGDGARLRRRCSAVLEIGEGWGVVSEQRQGDVVRVVYLSRVGND
jgi:hypothetical protein